MIVPFWSWNLSDTTHVRSHTKFQLVWAINTAFTRGGQNVPPPLTQMCSWDPLTIRVKDTFCVSKTKCLKEAGSKVAFDVVGYKLKSIWMSKEQQQPGPTAACRMRFYERDCINHVSVVLKDDRTTLLLQNTSLCHNSQYSQDYYEKMRGTKSFKSYEYDA